VKNLIDCIPDNLMNGFSLIRNVLVYYRPYAIMYFLSRKFVKDSIGTSQNIIELLATILLEINFWVTNYNVWIATKLWLFSL